MFHNSTAIRSSLRGSGKGGWPGEELSAIDKDQTLIQLTQNAGGGGEEGGQIIQVNMIPSSTLNPVQETNPTGVHIHNSTGHQAISEARRRPLWPGEDLSAINNENNGTRDNENNEKNGGVADVFDPTHRSSIHEEQEGHHQENEENLTFSLEELGLTPEEYETLTHPNISKLNVNYPPQSDLDLEESRRPQRKEMALEGVLKLPSKEICMDPKVRDIKLMVNYGTQEHEVLRMDLHRLMHLLRLISFPQPQPPSSSQEPEEEVICAPDSSPTTPSSSSSISGGSDTQRVPEVQDLIHEIKNRPGPSKNKNKKKPTPKPTPKVRLPKGRGVVHNSSAKTDGKAGWRYSCYFCTKRCRVLSHLNQHILIHTTEKPFPCDQCTKGFNTNGNLTSHKRLHALDLANRRPFKCQECRQSFTQNGSLTSHMKIIHRGLKDVKCLKCHKMFGTNWEMMTHHDAKHLKIRYPCSKPSCGKTFSFKGDVQRHEKQVHPKILQPIPE